MNTNEIATNFNEFKEKMELRLNKLEDGVNNFMARNIETKAIKSEIKSEESLNFIDYLRTGNSKNLEALIEIKSKKGYTEGGIPASSNASSLIAYNLENLCVMRKLCGVQFISSDSFDVIIEENGGKASWGTPEHKEPYIKKFIRVHELVAEPKATSKLIEDVKIDIEEFMSLRIAESFAIAEDDAFLNGDGVEMPMGILNTPSGKNQNFIEDIKGALTADVILSLIDSLDSFYHSNTAFLMNRETEAEIKKLKDSTGRHLWQNRTGDMSYNTILGIPIFTTNFMPNLTSKERSIIFGNFTKGYKIVEKMGNYIMRDPFTERPFIKFYTSKKIGGDVIDGKALKAFRLA